MTISPFLVGGDLYTAYTFVAVPALLFGAGATGFFAVPYTIIIYPLGFLVLCRLWSVSHRHGFVTPADFVRARSGSSTMALLVAVTGIVATMPYIALQLVGIEAVLRTMRVPGAWPLIVAFGQGEVEPRRRRPTASRRAGQAEPRRHQAQHVGAAGVQPAARADRAARLHGDRGQGDPLSGDKAGSVDSNTVVPVLFDRMFPDWFAGVAYAAVAIGVLVPAAIMAIAAANLFTRNIYKEYLNRRATPAQEATVSKVTSLVVKAGAVLVILLIDPQFSIDLQPDPERQHRPRPSRRSRHPTVST